MQNKKAVDVLWELLIELLQKFDAAADADFYAADEEGTGWMQMLWKDEMRDKVQRAITQTSSKGKVNNNAVSNTH